MCKKNRTICGSVYVRGRERVDCEQYGQDNDDGDDVKAELFVHRTQFTINSLNDVQKCDANAHRATHSKYLKVEIKFAARLRKNRAQIVRSSQHIF